MSVVPLADVKAHLNMKQPVNDAELQAFIDAAEVAISHRVGPLAPTSVTERYSGGGSALVLRQWPVQSVTSLGYTDGSTVTLTDLDVDTDTGVVYWNTGTAGQFAAGSRNVTVTYSAGYATLPADLVQAVKELTRHLWETQRGNNTPQRPGFTDEPVVAGAFTSWPTRVQELVAPYTVPRVG